MLVRDPNGDSLSYQIVKALQGPNTPVPYTPPYSEYLPFPLNKTLPPHNQYTWNARVVLDTITGDFAMNPLNNGVAPITGDLCIRIIQWNYRTDPITGARTPFITGITMRNLQIYNIPCGGNNPPRFETSPSFSLTNNRPKYNWSVCAGEQVCFTVTAKDTDFRPQLSPPRIDTTFISWNHAINKPGVTFAPDYDTTNASARPREDRWKFCWQTDTSDGRNLPYYFTVRADDNFCPNPGKVMKTFSIQVLPVAQATLTKNELGCAKWNLVVNKPNTQQNFQSAFIMVAKKPNDYSFSQGADTIYSTNPNPSGVSPLPIINDTFEFTQPGKYAVKYVISNDANNTYCTRIFYDTLTIDTVLQVFTTDTFKCKHSTLTLSGNAQGGEQPYVYNWYRNAVSGQPLTGSANTRLAADTQTVNYILQVKDAKGCYGQDTIKLLVKTLSDSSILHATNDIQCLTGNTFTFGKGNTAGFINATHQWVYDSNVKTDSAISISYTTIGTKKVGLIVKEAQGCADTVYKEVTVAAMPETTNIIQVNDSIQCISGNNFTFSKTTLPGYVYTWSYDNTSTANLNLQVTYSSAGNKTIRLRIQTPEGCVDTAYKTVVVTSKPTVGAINSTSTISQCITTNKFIFTHAFQPGLTYQWVYDNKTTTDSILTYSYASAGDKTVTLKATEYGGCTDSVSKTIKVTPAPVLANIIQVNNPAQCLGSNSFSFTYAPLNNPHLFKHTWLFKDSTYLTYPFIVTGQPLGNTQVKLIISQNDGCADTAIKEVVVHPVPSTINVFSVNDSSQCLKGNLFSFSYTSPPSETNTASWYIDGTVTNGASAQHSFTTAGVKETKLILTSANGCKDSVLKTVTVKPAPVYSVIGGPQNGLIADTVYTYSIPPIAEHEYKWDAGNATFTETDTGSTVKVKWQAPSGWLSVAQTLHGCSYTDSIHVNVQPVVGLKEETAISGLLIIPNPNNGIFTIQLQSARKQTDVITLYNSLGAEVLKKQHELQAGENNIRIKADIQPGVYLLTIQDGTTQSTKRVIISK